MKYQIVDKEYGVQIIPGIKATTIEADNTEQAWTKVMKLLGIPQEFLDMMDIEIQEVS